MLLLRVSNLLQLRHDASPKFVETTDLNNKLRPKINAATFFLLGFLSMFNAYVEASLHFKCQPFHQGV